MYRAPRRDAAGPGTGGLEAGAYFFSAMMLSLSASTRLDSS